MWNFVTNFFYNTSGILNICIFIFTSQPRRFQGKFSRITYVRKRSKSVTTWVWISQYNHLPQSNSFEEQFDVPNVKSMYVFITINASCGIIKFVSTCGDICLTSCWWSNFFSSLIWCMLSRTIYNIRWRLNGTVIFFLKWI